MDVGGSVGVDTKEVIVNGSVTFAVTDKEIEMLEFVIKDGLRLEVLVVSADTALDMKESGVVEELV